MSHQKNSTAKDELEHDKWIDEVIFVFMFLYFCQSLTCIAENFPFEIQKIGKDLNSHTSILPVETRVYKNCMQFTDHYFGISLEVQSNVCNRYIHSSLKRDLPVIKIH